MNQNAPIVSILEFFSHPGVAMATASGVLMLIVLFAFALWFVFAVVMVRQADLMTKTVSTSLDPTIKLLAYAHLAASVIVLISVFMLL